MQNCFRKKNFPRFYYQNALSYRGFPRSAESILWAPTNHLWLKESKNVEHLAPLIEAHALLLGLKAVGFEVNIDVGLFHSPISF